MASEWFYRVAGEEHGPVSSRRLKELATSGELAPDDHIRRRESSHWTPAGQVKGLFGDKPSTSRSAIASDALPPPLPPRRLPPDLPADALESPTPFMADAEDKSTRRSSQTRFPVGRSTAIVAAVIALVALGIHFWPRISGVALPDSATAQADAPSETLPVDNELGAGPPANDLPSALDEPVPGDLAASLPSNNPDDGNPSVPPKADDDGPIATAPQRPSNDKQWISLFDGSSLDGWRPTRSGQFAVQDGVLVCHPSTAPRSRGYLFLENEGEPFEDFELIAEVKAEPKANGGIFFHTRFQDAPVPKHGLEVQIDNDLDKRYWTGSLFRISAVPRSVLPQPNEWFTLGIRVVGRQVTVEIDGKNVLDYIEPPNQRPHSSSQERLLSQGTFAIQSVYGDGRVFLRNIRVRRLGIGEGTTSKLPGVSEAEYSASHPLKVSKDAEGVIEWKGHRYWFSTDKLHFDEAEALAEHSGGHLVVIESTDENSFIARNIKTTTFIGIKKRNGRWTSSEGNVQRFFNWDRGQPSSLPDELYAGVRTTGIWHDFKNDPLADCIEWDE